MAGPDQVRMPSVRKRRSASAGGPERRNQVKLEIGSSIVSDEGIRGLLEDWLIPTIVEGLIQDQMKRAARTDHAA
jgi:hypothetical protein